MKIKIIHDDYLDRLEIATNNALEELKKYEILDVRVSSYNDGTQFGFYATITYK